MNDEHEINFKIFNHATYCNDDDDETCQCIPRIINCLKYYKLINKEPDIENVQKQFLMFLQSNYIHYLDDITHLIASHGRNLENISKSLFSSYGFERCDSKKCSFIRRFDINDDNKSDEDPLYIFYTQMFHSIHVYLFHLDDLGLRSFKNSKADTNPDNNKEIKNVNDLPNFDPVFSRKKETIMKKKREHDAYFSRIIVDNINNKFTLTLDADTERLFLDGFMDAVLHKSTKDTAVTVQLYISQEEYDTDSIQQDIDKYSNYQTSNIYQQIQDRNIILAMCDYYALYRSRLNAMTFSVGCLFWYWPHYEPNNDIQNDCHDHHYISEPKFASFKEEILQYCDETNFCFVPVQHYLTKVLLKSEQYINNRNVKQLKARTKIRNQSKYHYGIPDGAKFERRHIMSLILYCDFTKLSTAFSKTFRKINPMEKMSQVKTRNQKYWWMSRNLREVVELFGKSYEVWDNAKHKFVPDEVGPFFTGISTVLVIKQFNIRLYGPTSTTIYPEVAINFAKTNGMILKLNNEYIGSGRYQRFFNASWLSSFPEEDERLTFGGSFFLQIQSITIIATSDKFKIFCKAMYYFDAVLSGVPLKDINVTNKAIKLISSVINCNSKLDVSQHEYIKKCWRAFVISKQTITLNMYYIQQYCHETIQRLFYHSLEPSNDKDNIVYQDNKSKSNMILVKTLNIFTELETINIYAANRRGTVSYPFSLSELLNELQTVRTQKILCHINAVWKDTCNRKDGKRSWIFYQYSSNIKSTLFTSSLSKYINNSGKYLDLLTIESN